MNRAPKPHSIELRKDAVRVVRNRDPGVMPDQIAADLGLLPLALSNWLRWADVEDGVTPGVTSHHSHP